MEQPTFDGILSFVVLVLLFVIILGVHYLFFDFLGLGFLTVPPGVVLTTS
jgi:hypothetical protein